MRLFLVRRTRSFIKNTYAHYDPIQQAHYLELRANRFYFPKRIPRVISFHLGSDDPYARLFSEEVVDLIGGLHLPRYGLENYLIPNIESKADPPQKRLIQNLNRAGRLY